MIYPQYIVLTVTRVAVKSRNNPKIAQAQIINPPVRQLFVLPLMMSKAQHADSTEIEIDGQLLSISEHFDDVVNSINDALMGGLAVAKPARRDLAVQAAQQRPEAPSPLHEVAAAMRQAEGAKHQGEIPGVPSSDITGEQLNAAGVRDFPDEDAPRWDDFAQTSGENVGAPAAEKRQPVAGDLRIVKYDGDLFWIEIAVSASPDRDCGDIGWFRHGVPSELMPMYESVEAAREAVKLAGYIRRLIEE